MKAHLRLVSIGAVLLGLLQGAVAQNWTGTLLNDFAVKDEDGKIVVLGTEGSYNDNPAWDKNTAFDGDATTFFDPPTEAVKVAGVWVGIELTVPKMLTRVRYAGRNGSGTRMNGCLIQGANESDFSDAVTLLVTRTTSGHSFNDDVVSTSDTFQTFRFFRLMSPNPYPQYTEGICAGNVGELQFYGVDLPTGTELPTKPNLSFIDVANYHANLRVNVSANAMAYEIEAQRVGSDEWHEAGSMYFKNAGNVIWSDPVAISCAYEYRIRGVNLNGVSEWVICSMVPRMAIGGSWIGSQGTYGSSMTGDKAFDGNIGTFFDGPSSSDGSGLWTGLDLGKPWKVAAIAYLPRFDGVHPGRIKGGWFEGADNVEFDNPTLLYTIPEVPVMTQMSIVTLAAPVTYRYFRYCSPDGGWGNVADIEFILDESTPPPPSALVITEGDMTNHFPTLTWQLPSFAASGMIYRATSPGGPYVNITQEGLPDDQSSFTDTTLTVGVQYWYRVVGKVGDYESEPSNRVSYRRLQRLERDWSDLTQVKPGMSVYFTGKPYVGNASWDAYKAFDNNLDTFVDLTPTDVHIGVDFGEPCSIGYFRLVPRNSSEFTNRVNSSVLYGWSQPDEPVALATVSNVILKTYTQYEVSDTTSYRISYLTKLSGEFFANIAELEFYGWPATSLADVLCAPTMLSAAMQSDGVQLVWNDGINALSYRVERCPADGSSGWESVGTTSANTLSDLSPALGTRMLYRVVAVSSSDEEAFSDDLLVVAYVAGDGSGLASQYTIGYTKNYSDPSSRQMVQSGVDPVVDFNWSGGPIVEDEGESVNNVRVVWGGTLIVPRSDIYAFRLRADDGACVTIGGEQVLNKWLLADAAYTSSKYLQAGEHAIRVDYYQGTGGAGIRLEWDAPGYFEVIPTSQFKPGVIAGDMIGPWMGHTFNVDYLGWQELDEGSDAIRVGAYGGDFSGPVDRGHFLWQEVEQAAFRIDVKAELLINTLYPSAKALLVVKAGESGESPVISVMRIATPVNGGNIGVKGRLAYDTNVGDLLSPAWVGSASNPVWLRIQRQAGIFSCWYKSEGSAVWEKVYEFEDPEKVFGKRVYAGFGVCSPVASAQPEVLQFATFSDISIRPISGLIMMVK